MLMCAGPPGIPLEYLQGNFETLNKKPIDYEKCGFQTLRSLIESWNDVFTIIQATSPFSDIPQDTVRARRYHPSTLPPLPGKKNKKGWLQSRVSMICLCRPGI